MNIALRKNAAGTTASKTGFVFLLVTTLLVLRDFPNNLNPIQIPLLKKSFTYSTGESNLVGFAVYIAYFLMAIPAGYAMKKLGYKVGIITGIFVFSIGAFLFISARLGSY